MLRIYWGILHRNLKFNLPGRVLGSIGLSFLLSAGSITPAAPQSPAPESGRWYYHRAIVFSMDQKPRVEAELRKALQVEPSLAEARYLLGKVLLERSDYDGAIAELRATLKQVPEHLPARLALAAALHRKQQLREVMLELEVVLPLIGRKGIEVEVARIKSVLAGKDAEKSRKFLQGQTQDLLQWIDDVIKETPQTFQRVTIDRGLRDMTVLLEVIEMYWVEEDQSPEQVGKLLRTFIDMHNGFFPVALIQYGAVLQQKDARAALAAYETSIAQLNALGLKAGEDYDTSEIVALRQLLGIAK